MLDADHDGRGILEVGTLIAANVGLGNLTAQVRIFARNFGDTSPTSITGDIDHRAIDPVDAHRRCFASRHACRLFDEIHIPRGGDGQWNRVGGNKTMNNIVAEKQGDTEACAIDGIALDQTDLLHVGETIDATHFSTFDLLDGERFLAKGGVGEVHPVADEIQLADLLFERHLAHQFADVGIHFAVAIVVLLATCQGDAA